MKQEVKLPDMGEGVEKATVVSVLVKVGDKVRVDQGLCELETDKAVAEVPSPSAGTVKEIHVKDNQEVKPGDLLMTLDSADGEEEEEPEPTGRRDQPPEKPPKGQKKPAAEKPKAEKAKAKKQKPHEAPPEAETEPADEGEEAPKQAEEDEAEQEQPAAKRSAAEPRGPAAGAEVPAGPSTRRLARELGVDLSDVTASDASGWITEDDVKAAAREATRRARAGGEQDDWGPVRREKLSSVRATIARRMRESRATAAHVTHFDDADVTELEEFRRQENQQIADEGVKLSPLPLVVRSAVNALKHNPLLNASIDIDGGVVIYHEYISIGIAVDTPRGLLVPVIREADRLSLLDLARAIDQAAAKAREGKLSAEDLRGGTFTVSNLGSVGGRYATPIINTPESAVLLPGRARQEPVALDGRVQIRTVLPLSLSYDHRLVDGADAARFLNAVIADLQSPNRLLTH